MSDCIFEIHQQWQIGFSRVYSNCCCSCSFKPEIIRIGLSSHKMYGNNILNFQESTVILNALKKNSGNLSYVPRILVYEYLIKHYSFFLFLRSLVLFVLFNHYVISHFSSTKHFLYIFFFIFLSFAFLLFHPFMQILCAIIHFLFQFLFKTSRNHGNDSYVI